MWEAKWINQPLGYSLKLERKTVKVQAKFNDIFPTEKDYVNYSHS